MSIPKTDMRRSPITLYYVGLSYQIMRDSSGVARISSSERQTMNHFHCFILVVETKNKKKKERKEDLLT